MKIIPIGVSAALLLASPAGAQETPRTSAQISQSCIEQFMAENNLTEAGMRTLQYDRPYLHQGREVYLARNGRPSDLCDLANSQEYARELDLTAGLLADAQQAARDANRRAEEAEAAILDQTEPYGFTWTPIVRYIQWSRWSGELGWSLFILILYLFLRNVYYTKTPWGKDAVRRKAARRDSRLHRRHARSAGHMVDFSNS